MSVWLVRAGKHGEVEDFAMENNISVVAWDEVPDLSKVKSKPELLEKLETIYPEAKFNTLKNWSNQLWAFINTIQPGDLIALPLKKRSMIAFAEVTGKYSYSAGNPVGARHTRPVKWVKTISRSQIDQDLLYSLGAFMSVCQIQRNEAETRLRALVKGKAPAANMTSEEFEELQAPPNLQEYSRDLIREHIGKKFKGHHLTHLVDEVLKAQGYQTSVSPEGPDGGVDIIAGNGPMGFDLPRLCVQVKSGETSADVKILRELQGVIKSFGADHGLLVSWGGFKTTVEKEAKHAFFNIRLWDADDLIEQILTNYEKLSETTQTEIPLKRIWTLVTETE